MRQALISNEVRAKLFFETGGLSPDEYAQPVMHDGALAPLIIRWGPRIHRATCCADQRGARSAATGERRCRQRATTAVAGTGQRWSRFPGQNGGLA